MKYTRFDLQTGAVSEEVFETEEQALTFFADSEREAMANEMEDDDLDSIKQLSDQEILAIEGYQIVKID